MKEVGVNVDCLRLVIRSEPRTRAAGQGCFAGKGGADASICEAP
jgi:hypothetical protein